MKKVLFAVFLAFLILLGALIAIPLLYKNQIKLFALAKINEQLNAKIHFDGINVSFFSHFPSLSCAFNKVSVSGIDTFESDTLFYAKSVGFKLSLLPLITKNKLTIKYIYLDNAQINAIQLNETLANWHIFKKETEELPSTDTTKQGFDFAIEGYKITNAQVFYTNYVQKSRFILKQLNHTGSGDFTQDDFKLQTETKIDSITLTYNGIEYLKQVQMRLLLPIAINKPNFSFNFEPSIIQLNALALAFEGQVAVPDTSISINMSFSTPKTDFKHLLSLVPGAYNATFDGVKTAGNFQIDSKIQGQYGMGIIPKFDFKLMVSDASFQYPSLPEAVKDIQIAVEVANKTGQMDATTLHIQKCSMNLGGNPFNAMLMLTKPQGNTFVDGALTTKLNLDNVKNYFPLSTGDQLKGKIDADLTFAGLLNDLSNKQYDKFKFTGLFNLAGFFFQSLVYPQGVLVHDAKLRFNPQQVYLENFDAVLGTSDVKAKGHLDNLLFYYFKNEPLKGKVFMKSKYINLNEWMSDPNVRANPDETAIETTALKAIPIPQNLDVEMQAQISKILYDNMELSELNGTLLVANQQLILRDVSMKLLGGQIQASGYYSTQNGILQPSVNFQLALQNFDIQQSVQAFQTMQQIVPVAKYARGSYTTTFNLNGFLHQDMTPNLQSLSGGGLIKLKQGSVQGFEPLNQLSNLLQMPHLSRADFKDLHMAFEFEEGRLFVSPFKLQIAEIPVNIMGSNGFDQTIDYTINMAIPQNRLGALHSTLNNLLEQANKAGINIQNKSDIPLQVLVSGSVTKPILKTNINQLANTAGNSLLDVAKNELNKQKQMLEDRAKAEANRLKLEAEAQKQAIEQQAKTELARAKAEAEQRKREIEEQVKAEAARQKAEADRKADSLKRIAEEEAKKRIRNLLPR